MAKSAWDQFPVATPLDLALHAEGVDSKVADIARSIYAQESSSGKNTKTSNAGAVGGMQVIPATFARVAEKDWDINDPVHNARAGVRYIKKLHERGGGDPGLTAAGYYGGEGAQDKAKRGIAVSDPRNPRAPNTLQYAQQVVGRIPVSNEAPKAAKAADWSQFPEATPQEIAEFERSRSEKAPKSGEAAAGAKSKKADSSKKKERTTMEEVARQVGLTARSGIAGLVSLPAMASDAVTGVINAGADLVAGKGNGPRFIPAGAAVQQAMTKLGLPEPETAQERVVADMTQAMAGAGGMVKGAEVLSRAAGPVAASVGKTLAEGPVLQLASSAAGAGASGATREAGGGTGAQIAAGLAASILPTSGAALAGEAAKRTLRGGEEGRKRVAANLETFKKSGTTPTLGQATESRIHRATESVLAKTPGGAGVIAQRAQKQADEMSAAIQQLSDELAPDASAVNAGEAITRGVNAFKAHVKQTQAKLYDALDAHLPAESRIPSAKTQAALADLNADIAGAPELSKWFKNARIKGIEGGLKSDTSSVEAILSRPGMKQAAEGFRKQLLDAEAKAIAINAERKALGLNVFEPTRTAAQIEDEVTQFLVKQADGNLPYESLKKLRTLVGRELADNSLVSDVPRSKWAALYGAISEDLGDAATAAGPKAKAAWDRANKYTRLSLERMDQLSSVVNRDAPEKVFAAAISGTSEGATTVRRLVGALPAQERRELAAAVLQRMGRAAPGQQNAMGDAFSSETFLTNLSKLSPSARIAIFGKTSRSDLEKRVGEFAKLAESRRDGGKIFANPSGTASALAQMGAGAGMGAGVLASLSGGGVLPLLGGFTVPAAANVIAKAATSPKLVERLATPINLRPGAQGAMVGAAARALQPASPSAEPDWSQFPEATPEEIAEFQRAQAGAAGQPPQGQPAMVAPGAAPQMSTPGGAQPADQVPGAVDPERPAIEPQSLRMNRNGEPFATQRAAMIDAARNGGTVVPVAGGFAVVPAGAEPVEAGQEPGAVGADEMPPGAQAPGAMPGDVMNPSGSPFATRMAAVMAANRIGGQVVPTEGGFVARPAAPNSTVAQPSGASQQTDVLNPSGQHFKTKMAAERAAKKTPGDVVAVPGGFVVRPKAQEPLFDAPQATPDAAAGPQADPAAAPAVGGIAPGVPVDTAAGEGSASPAVRGDQPEQLGALNTPLEPAGVIAEPLVRDLQMANVQPGIADQQAANPGVETGQQVGEWQTFPPDTQTLGIPRAEMPQIKSAHRGALTNFLNARGVEHEADEVDPSQLKPTQAEFSPEKVERAKSFDGPGRAVLVSQDGHILDGHHEWLAKGNKGEPVKIIRFQAPIAELLPMVREFPSSTVDTATADVQNQAPATEAGPEGAQAARVEAPAPAGGDGGAAVAGVPAERYSGEFAELEAAGVTEFEQRTAIDTTQSTAMREQAQQVRESQKVAEGGPLSKAANVGVEATAAQMESQADALVSAQDRAIRADILNPAGMPFMTWRAASLAAKRYGGEVVPVGGGFAVRAA